MKIALLHKYGRQAAGFRCRLENYLPYLQVAGHTCHVDSLLDDHYLQYLFTHNHRKLSLYGMSFLRRLCWFWRVNHVNLVIIYLDFLPYFPPWFERYLQYRKIPYLFDYDDAMFHFYEQHPNYLIRHCFKNKLPTVLRLAHGVIAGSDDLMRYAQQFNTRVYHLPTVVNACDYRQRQCQVIASKQDTFIIGWIGSPSTTKYLSIIEPVLQVLSRQISLKLLIIGGETIYMKGIHIESLPWSEHDEVEQLLRFDVGIMPLSDDSWTKGKCGFKLVQYMACGIPSVASAVGANKQLLVHGQTGFLVNTLFEWQNALLQLAYSSSLRQYMGKKARQRFEAHYALSVMAPKFVNIVNAFV